MEMFMFSRTLLSSRDIGLNSLGFLIRALFFLGIGTTLELFQAVGGRPSWMERLKSFVIAGAISTAVALSIRADMPSCMPTSFSSAEWL